MKNRLNRLENMETAVAKADIATAETKEQPKQVRKHVIIPKDWSDAIKSNYGGTMTSYILIALKAQLEKDGYL